MAKKEISGYIKLQINGGQANPAPPVGPALGQRGKKSILSPFLPSYIFNNSDWLFLKIKN